MDISKLKNVKKIVVHKYCHDGTTSAMIIKDVLPNVEIFFADHKAQDYLNLPATPNLLFCDISPPQERYWEFLDAEALVLDHHVSVDYIIKEFEKNGLGVYGVTEDGTSGATLAYENVWLPLENQANTDKYSVSKLARFAGIVDTYQTHSIEWVDACIQQSAIGFFGEEHFLQKNHKCLLTDEEVKIGTLLQKRHKVNVQNTANKAFTFNFKNKKVSIISGHSIISDTAEELRKRGVNIIFAFQYKTNEKLEPQISYSIRSDKTFNCAKFATIYNGGGHLPAAAFLLPVNLDNAENPYKTLFNLLQESGESCILA